MLKNVQRFKNFLSSLNTIIKGWTNSNENLKGADIPTALQEVFSGKYTTATRKDFVSYYNDALTNEGVNEGTKENNPVIRENIKSGINIWNNEEAPTDWTNTGTFSDDATAQAAQIYNGKTSYYKGEKIVGTLMNIPSTVSSGSVLRNYSIYDSNKNLINGTMPKIFTNLDTDFSNSKINDIYLLIGSDSEQLSTAGGLGSFNYPYVSGCHTYNSANQLTTGTWSITATHNGTTLTTTYSIPYTFAFSYTNSSTLNYTLVYKSPSGTSHTIISSSKSLVRGSSSITGTVNITAEWGGYYVLTMKNSYSSYSATKTYTSTSIIPNYPTHVEKQGFVIQMNKIVEEGTNISEPAQGYYYNNKWWQL